MSQTTQKEITYIGKAEFNRKKFVTMTRKLDPLSVSSNYNDLKYPISRLIDGRSDPELRWRGQGKNLFFVIELKENVIVDKIVFNYYMKKNEKRNNIVNIKALMGDTLPNLENQGYDFIALAFGAENRGERVAEFDISNIVYKSPPEIISNPNIDVVIADVYPTKRILVELEDTTQKNKWLSITEVEIYGVYEKEVVNYIDSPNPPQCGENEHYDPVTKTCVPNNEPDEDTYDKNGVIHLPNYEVLKEGFSFEANLRDDGSYRQNFVFDKTTQPEFKDSIIIGSVMTVVNKDNIAFKNDGYKHNTDTPELGRCNILSLELDTLDSTKKTIKVKYKVEKQHLGGSLGYQDLDEKIVSTGLQKTDNLTIGIMCVDQLIVNKNNEKIGRTFSLFVDENPIAEDGKLNNNYRFYAEFKNTGQYLDKDTNQPIPVYFESTDQLMEQHTIRIDKQTPDVYNARFSFVRAIKNAIDSEIPPDHNTPPNAVLIPQIQVLEKGQEILIDGTKSNDVEDSTDKLIFEWGISQPAIPLTLLDDGRKVSLTYPSFESKPINDIFVTLKVTDTNGASRTAKCVLVDNIVYGTNPPPNSETITIMKNGQALQFVKTGRKIKVEWGSDHRNGQRFNVNHKFENYCSDGIFTTGKGQTVMEEKTDGGCHGCGGNDCNDKDNPYKICMWCELGILIDTGEPKADLECPHPDNNSIDLSFATYKKGLGYAIKETDIRFTTVCVYDSKKERNYFMGCTKNINENPELVLHLKESEICKGQDTKPFAYLFPRDIKTAIDHSRDGQGFEAEYRMNNAKSGTSNMKEAYIYEIKPIQ